MQKNILDTLTLKGIEYIFLEKGRKVKQASITFKTSPEIKENLEKLAKKGFRSLSAQVEMIVVKYLENQKLDSEEREDRSSS